MSPQKKRDLAAKVFANTEAVPGVSVKIADSSEAAERSIGSPEKLEVKIESGPKPIPETIDRVSFKLTPEGRIDTGSLRKATEEKARKAIVASVIDPEFRRWAGIEPGSIPEIPIPQIVDVSLVGNLLDLQVNVEAAMLSKKTGLPYEEVRAILAYNVREREGLSEQGAKLANKYIPLAWLEKADVFLFLATIVSLTTMKMNALNDYAKTKFNRQVNAPTHDESSGVKAKSPEPEPNPVSMEIPHPGSAAANGMGA